MGIFTQMSMATPRIRMLAPIVMMTRFRGVAFLRGLIAKRSKVIPTAVAAAMARIAAGISGIFMKVRKKRVNIRRASQTPPGQS